MKLGVHHNVTEPVEYEYVAFLVLNDTEHIKEWFSTDSVLLFEQHSFVYFKLDTQVKICSRERSQVKA